LEAKVAMMNAEVQRLSEMVNYL